MCEQLWSLEGSSRGLCPWLWPSAPSQASQAQPGTGHGGGGGKDCLDPIYYLPWGRGHGQVMPSNYNSLVSFEILVEV